MNNGSFNAYLDDFDEITLIISRDIYKEKNEYLLCMGRVCVP